MGDDAETATSVERSYRAAHLPSSSTRSDLEVCDLLTGDGVRRVDETAPEHVPIEAKVRHEPVDAGSLCVNIAASVTSCHSATSAACTCGMSTGAIRMSAPPRPNILVVLADDLGWGDLGCYGATRIPTPAIDALARAGMLFLDARAASSVCTPSRYALLTGRYPWRSPLKQGVLMGHGPALIEPERPTLAATLRRHGYRTAAVGKWHLGLGWRQRDGSVWDARRAGDPLEYQLGDPLASYREQGLDSGAGIDYTRPFTGGPTALGFDEFFGIAGSLDMPPYAFLEQDRTVGVPETWKTRFLPGQRPGLEAAGWDEYAVDLERGRG
jgi:hypothetical protein